jgi:hypothetical protein
MRAPWLLTSLMVLAAVQPAQSRTVTIDDSGTLPYDTPLSLNWQQRAPNGTNANQLTGTLTVRVKLNVAPWLKRTGRIYLVLPAQPPGAMAVTWSTQGRLLPGRLTAGTRALVYSGPITTPFIEDVLQLTLSVDASRLQPQPYHVNFNFEMDEG